MFGLAFGYSVCTVVSARSVAPDGAPGRPGGRPPAFDGAYWRRQAGHARRSRASDDARSQRTRASAAHAPDKKK